MVKLYYDFGQNCTGNNLLL